MRSDARRRVRKSRGEQPQSKARLITAKSHRDLNMNGTQDRFWIVTERRGPSRKKRTSSSLPGETRKPTAGNGRATIGTAPVRGQAIVFDQIGVAPNQCAVATMAVSVFELVPTRPAGCPRKVPLRPAASPIFAALRRSRALVSAGDVIL